MEGLEGRRSGDVDVGQEEARDGKVKTVRVRVAKKSGKELA